MANLDMANERRYLEGLMQTGNPGQADWARQQARTYGLGDLGIAPVRQGMEPGAGQQVNPQLLAGVGTGAITMAGPLAPAEPPGAIGDIIRWQAANPIQPVFKPGTKFLSRETAEAAQARQAEQDKYQAEQDRQTAARQAERDRIADEQWAKSFGLQQSQESRLSKPGTLSPLDQARQDVLAGKTVSPEVLAMIGAEPGGASATASTQTERQAQAAADAYSGINEAIAAGIRWPDLEKRMRTMEPEYAGAGLNINDVLFRALDNYERVNGVSKEVQKAREKIMAAIERDFNMSRYGTEAKPGDNFETDGGLLGLGPTAPGALQTPEESMQGILKNLPSPNPPDKYTRLDEILGGWLPGGAPRR